MNKSFWFQNLLTITKIYNFRTSDAMFGTICTEVAPVPITAILLPFGSKPLFHSAEWKASPLKEVFPLKSGVDGTCSAPPP